MFFWFPDCLQATSQKSKLLGGYQITRCWLLPSTPKLKDLPVLMVSSLGFDEALFHFLAQVMGFE